MVFVSLLPIFRALHARFRLRHPLRAGHAGRHMSRAKRRPAQSLADLRNVGRATLGDFATLGITTLTELAASDPDVLYRALERATALRQDPCARDVFAATIHQARTGEALDWWHFTRERPGRA
jgi:hypothetical protein